MALNVIEMAPSNGKQHVTVTSDNPKHNLAISELQTPDARNLAIKHAAQNGVTNARCEMPSAPYPVDPEGQPVADPRAQKIASYRVDIPINTGL